uniref:eIF3h C-terminal domain-containing protein n=1 Tax=Chelydra serpentina TaxID=8475 RepID=A0A8C3S8B7_CHESE
SSTRREGENNYTPKQKQPSAKTLSPFINNYCQNIKEFTAQNLGKLFMAQALQEYNN